MSIDKSYDIVMIGTSPIFILEAIHQNFSGKKVLMIEEESVIGGAWKNLRMFGFTDVENAIHYLLPNKCAIKFFTQVLGINIVSSKNKKNIFQIFNKSFVLNYDSMLSRLLRCIYEDLIFYKKTLKVFSLLFKQKPSLYFQNGSPELISRLHLLLSKTNISILLSSKITDIDFFEDNAVNVKTSEYSIKASKICISHGSRLPISKSNKTQLILTEKIHFRPALHILIDSPKPPRYNELIFIKDSIVKYVHNITQYAQSTNPNNANKYILVLALQHNQKSNQLSLSSIHNKLIGARMICEDSTLLDSYWQDVYLPRLSSSDLDLVKSKYPAQVKVLKTENFTQGIGSNANRWIDAVSSLLAHSN
jgi:hypothetical protein